MMANGQSQYRQNSVYSASSEELTLMLYNGLVKFIMVAQDAVIRKDVQNAHNAILRAQDIIHEFQVTLDKKYEVSKGLDCLYEYMNHQLMQANLNKDEKILEEVLGFARELRDTWSQAMKIAKQSNAIKMPEAAYR